MPTDSLEHRVMLTQQSIEATRWEHEPTRTPTYAQFAQASEVAFEETAKALKAIGEQMERHQAILLWLSKRQWPMEHDATWDDLIKQYEKDTSPEPLPALPNGGYRVGR